MGALYAIGGLCAFVKFLDGAFKDFGGAYEVIKRRFF